MECGQRGPGGLNVPNLVALVSVSGQENVQIHLLKTMENIV